MTNGDNTDVQGRISKEKNDKKSSKRDWERKKGTGLGAFVSTMRGEGNEDSESESDSDSEEDEEAEEVLSKTLN